LGHEPTDQRGNRRCFTISSSPTEEDVRIGIKFYPNPSSFKKTLANMKAGNIIMASQLSGDFVMPKDKNKKLVFIAGGIGITPFRSMAKYLIDKNERRDIVLLYSNKKENEIAYRDIFDKAGEFGMKSVYTITDSGVREGWEGKIGFIDENMIKTEVPDFKDRIFYISGPHIMVTTFENVLKNMGVKRGQIKTDYFPGFA
jgi:ferredoxin-NADP reductase